MPRNLKPEDFELPDLPLRKADKGRFGETCRCMECGEEVVEQRWSPFWCPDHDIRRMARIKARFKEIEQSMR